MQEEAYTLRPVLRNRSAIVDWTDLQLFITWLMCEGSKIKCPLELRQGRSRANANVILVIPYLDTEYIMSNFDQMKVLLSDATSGASLFRLKTPHIRVDSGYCTAMQKLLTMDAIEELYKGVESKTVQNSIMPKEVMKEEDYPSVDELEDLSTSPSEMENTVTTDVSKESIVCTLRGNLEASRMLCKTKDDVNKAIERYKHTRFTYTDASPECLDEGNLDGGSKGPGECEFKLTDSLLEKYASYIHALRNDGDIKKMFAMDCEMVSTTKGTGLARITIVDVLFNVVFDSLVMPLNKVTNYRTLYSGITEELLDGVTVTLDDVNCALNRIIDSDTILIGHSLHYDLRACKISHQRVIDTAYMYRDRKTSSKPSLFTLCKTQLELDMQRQHGHDSLNDAVVSMYLAVEGIMVLSPFITVGVDILSETALKILTSDKGVYCEPRIHIFDPMADSYGNSISENVKIEKTNDDETSVNELLNVLMEHSGDDGTGMYVLVLREFQLNCIRYLFQNIDNKKSLTKRLNSKVVSAYFTKLSGTIERIAKGINHNDVLLVTNLVGNVAQKSILWRAMNGTNENKKNGLLKLLKTIYRMAHETSDSQPSNEENIETIPECISQLYAKSETIAISLLKREYEIASRWCELNWMTVVSKQESNKRRIEKTES